MKFPYKLHTSYTIQLGLQGSIGFLIPSIISNQKRGGETLKTRNQKPEIRNQELETRNQKLGTRNPKLKTRNFQKPEVRNNQEPETRIQKLGITNPKLEPRNPNPKPEVRNQEPETRNQKTRHQKPEITGYLFSISDYLFRKSQSALSILDAD